MSISVSGWARRSFIIGIRLWPPARIRASGPYLVSRDRACGTLVAFSYSTCAGTCMRHPLRAPGSGAAGLAAPGRPLAAFSSVASQPGWLPPRPCQRLPGSPLRVVPEARQRTEPAPLPPGTLRLADEVRDDRAEPVPGVLLEEVARALDDRMVEAR